MGSNNSKKPTIISCKTIIGFGSPNKSGKASSHGSPLGEDEIILVRKKLKWNNKPFEIPQEILEEWKKIGDKGELLEKKWDLIVVAVSSIGMEFVGEKLKKRANATSVIVIAATIRLI